MRQVAGTLEAGPRAVPRTGGLRQFGSDLDKATQAQLNRGQRLMEILKQDQFSPLPFSKQILIIFAGTSGFLDDLPVKQVREFEKELLHVSWIPRIPDSADDHGEKSSR